MYYNKKGKKIELLEWVKLLEDEDYKIIKQEEVNGKWISTIWLGLDYSFDGGKPIIFETMVFPKKGNWLEEQREGYSTLDEAIDGHNKITKSLT